MSLLISLWINKILDISLLKYVCLKCHHSFEIIAHFYSIVTSCFILDRGKFHTRRARVLGPRLLQNPVNPPGPGLSALSLPLAHDEEKYRSYPQTKALCAPLQGLELAEAGCTVMRAIEGRMGDQLIPNKDGDLYTKEKKDSSWAVCFFFNPSLQATFFFFSSSTV